VGTRGLTAVATDLAGNKQSQTLTYTVDPWAVMGFYAPGRHGRRGQHHRGRLDRASQVRGACCGHRSDIGRRRSADGDFGELRHEKHLGRLVQRARTPEGYDALLARFAQGPSRWSPMGWADEAVDFLEYVIHHEDVRQGGSLPLEPHPLPDEELQAIWHRLRGLSRLGYRRASVGATLAVPTGPAPDRAQGRGPRAAHGRPRGTPSLHQRTTPSRPRRTDRHAGGSSALRSMGRLTASALTRGSSQARGGAAKEQALADDGPVENSANLPSSAMGMWSGDRTRPRSRRGPRTVSASLTWGQPVCCWLMGTTTGRSSRGLGGE
jgi:hypothetical protein